MAATYNNQFAGGRGFRLQRPSYDLNANLLELHVQQDISQQLEPGEPEPYGSSSYSGSPTPPTTQQLASPQPFAAQLQPNGYFHSAPITMPHTTGSPVTPQFSHAAPGAPDSGVPFGIDMDFGNAVVQNGNSGVRAGNNGHAE